MSLTAMSAVWNADLPANQKLVMLALADYCGGGDGETHPDAWPSIATLARKTSMATRTVQTALKQLREAGVISRVGSSQWETTVWRLNLPGLDLAPSPSAQKCPLWVRRGTIKAFSQTCAYCGEQGDEKNGADGDTWQIDRIIPGRQGGRYDVYNVTLSCGRCNRRKSAGPAPEGTRSYGDLLDARHDEGGGAESAPPAESAGGAPRRIGAGGGAESAPKPVVKNNHHSTPAAPPRVEMDDLWDAMEAAHGYRPASPGERSRWGKVQKELLKLDATGDDYRRRHHRYRFLHPDWTDTPTAILNHWGELGTNSTKPRAVTRPTESDRVEAEPTRIDTANGLAQVRAALRKGANDE